LRPFAAVTLVERIDDIVPRDKAPCVHTNQYGEISHTDAALASFAQIGG
jgi:hypothetical protein